MPDTFCMAVECAAGFWECPQHVVERRGFANIALVLGNDPIVDAMISKRGLHSFYEFGRIIDHDPNSDHAIKLADTLQKLLNIPFPDSPPSRPNVIDQMPSVWIDFDFRFWWNVLNRWHIFDTRFMAMRNWRSVAHRDSGTRFQCADSKLMARIHVLMITIRHHVSALTA